MKALLITTGLVVCAFASILAWAILAEDPLGGEPHAVIALEEQPRDGAIPAAAVSSAASMPDLPSAQNDTITQPPAGFSVVGLNRTALASPPPQPVAALPEDTLQKLSPVPVAALVQESRYGPLPQVASDGRRPSEVYSRPSRYASRRRLGEPARIAVVVNGLGLSEAVTTQSISKLPGPVTLAFSPYGRNLQDWMRQAREAGHEVMLQVPLEPFDYPDNDPGPHTLLTSLPPEENLKRLQWLMARFTGYVGITNHMGAKFSASQESFLPVLEELKSRGLLYLDDGTAIRSTAGQIARDMGLSYSVAQVEIDVSQSPQEIDRALAQLEKTALESGFAIGVGTSLPVTIERLAKWADTLREKGIVLIPVSAAARVQHQS